MIWRAKGWVWFSRVSQYVLPDMDRHGITAALDGSRSFTALQEAVAAVRNGALEKHAER
jgi:hypothetical protein